MVYIYSVFSDFDYKIKKYSKFVKLIRFNFENYKFEVIFEIPDLKKLKNFKNHYEIIKEEDLKDEIDFITNYEIEGLNKIFVFAPCENQFKEIKKYNEYFNVIYSIFSQSQIDLWNKNFKLLYKSRMIDFTVSMVNIFYQEEFEELEEFGFDYDIF